MSERMLSISAPKLNGRATSIVLAKSNSYYSLSDSDLSGKQLVMKACWPEKTRLNEAHIIKHATEMLESNPETKEFVKNIPQLYGTLEIKKSDTYSIVEDLELLPPEKDPEKRILRLHLFSRLIPVGLIEFPRPFEKAWLDCFKCHYALWNRGIEHGDISIWNLMWYPSDNKYCGVLNDWDLAYVRGGIHYENETVACEETRQKYTGTLPFMARDLLENHFKYKSSKDSIVRLYRHDVESFIWVFVWWCLTPEDAEKDNYPVATRLLNKWCTGTPEDIRSSKNGYLMRTRKNPGIVLDETWLKVDLLCSVLHIIEHRRSKKGDKFVEPSEGYVYQVVLAIMGGNIIESGQIKRVLFPK